MPLEPGRELLHYRLVEKIGEGGMGVVWKASDTTLGRHVAIKVLPDDFASEPDRLARFEREARVLASLNHPNLAAAYGLHEAGVNFIVMELVDGETLADRLNRGPLSIDDTLEVARQLAEALEAAHDRGVIHRDLKPANIKLRPDGVLKVLDFGLARSATVTSADDMGRDAPTATSTQSGTILGTAPYMSPEQARGKLLCKRTDIWAMGCVLFECLTGHRPFVGETAADVLARIVGQDPDLSALPPETPAFLIRLIRRCLEKEPQRRLRDAGEVRVAIETFRADPNSDMLGSGASPADTAGAGRNGSAGRSSRRTVLPWILVATLGAVLAYVMTGNSGGTSSSAAVSRWAIALPANTRVDLPGPGGKFDYSNVVAISRDGSLIAFSVLDDANLAQIYLKSDGAKPQPVPGTREARAPFFSPDGQWLGFYESGKLWKVALRGGSPQEICDVGGRAIAFDATWSPDGKTILFTDDGLWRVSVADGAATRLTAPDPERGELGHHAPRFTADGRGALFTVSGSGGTHLAFMQLDGADWDVVIRDATQAVTVGDNQIIFARSGELFAATFDSDRQPVTGPELPVMQGVHTSPGLGGMVVTWFDVSETGTLAYIPVDGTRPDEQLLWVDFDGSETVIVEGPGTWVHPRLSPDQSRISLDIHTAEGMRDVYIYELERRQFQQLTHTGVTWESEWRPDGETLAVLSGAQPGEWSLHQVRSDFSGPLELLARTNHAIPGSWVDGGRALLYTEWDTGGFYRLTLDGERKSELIVGTGQRQGFPRVSPDGNWIAYVADESSRREVFVQSYPEMGATRKVSIEGGREPVWSRDGQSLFYRQGNRMLAVDMRGPSMGRPRVLFEGIQDAATVGHQHYDISGDGTRFLMVKHGEPSGPQEVRIVLNWSKELQAFTSSNTPE